MAITTDMQHFDSSEFDELIAAHGTPALWSPAVPCPCLDPITGQPDSSCRFCGDLPGWVWTDASSLRVFAPSRQRRDVYGEAGMQLDGMLTISFQTGTVPGHRDRIQLTAAAMVCTERHKRGEQRAGRSTERLRMWPAISVERCQAIVADSLVPFEHGVDFAIDDRGNIAWMADLDAGAAYTLRYQAWPTYVVLSPYSRDENGTAQPYRALCQRLDFMRDPRADE